MNETWSTCADGRTRSIDLRTPGVMAILNVTPDSFSDGGTYASVDDAVRGAERAQRDGAFAIDVGGESTRPGAAAVSVAEQINRTAPVIAAIRRALGDSLVISIDTTRAEVARAGLDAGADAVNDISAGRDDADMFTLVAARGAGLVLMHRLVAPSRDEYSTQYSGGAASKPAPVYEPDVVSCVREFLRERTAAAEAAGVPRERIVVDPGLGFGKSVEDNLRLIRGTEAMRSLGYPVMSGLSRKSFVGRVSGVAAERPPRDRLAGTIGLSVSHFAHGARIFRVHDVREHVEALNAAAALHAIPRADSR